MQMLLLLDHLSEDVFYVILEVVVVSPIRVVNRFSLQSASGSDTFRFMYSLYGLLFRSPRTCLLSWRIETVFQYRIYMLFSHI
jgi:hypothetical protein